MQTLDLVRADLIETATLAGLRCVAHVLATAASPDAWAVAAEDLRFAGKRAAALAAECLSSGDAEGAVDVLADEKEETGAQWVTAALVAFGAGSTAEA